MLLNSFIYYIFFCSSVLLYGIGFNRESVMCSKPGTVLFNVVKSYACVVISFVIIFFINKFLLIPLKLVEIYPFFALIVFIIISVFFELLIQITTKRSSSEFAISFLVLLLAVNEGVSVIDGILICTGALSSFYLLIPILYSLEKRMTFVKKESIFKQKCLVFLSMVILMLALYSINISWLNEGVIK